jgi:CBS domain-containing protein
MDDLILKDIVSPEFFMIGPDWKLTDAVKYMTDNKASYVLVVKDNKPEGILTEKDMVGFLEESFEGATWNDMTVDHIMVSPVTSVGWDLYILEVLAIKQNSNIRHIPVVDDDGNIFGVLTENKIIDALYQYCQDNGLWT